MNVSDEKVIRGREGWLFLANDTNRVLAQHKGELLLEESQLTGWQHILERRKHVLQECGIDYLFAIAPDTHAVYPDKLPEGMRHARVRPVTQLCEHLAAAGSPVHPIYPLAELRKARTTAHVCSPLDTHWTDLGAFVAYTRIAEELEKLTPMRRVRKEDLIILSQLAGGDLGVKVEAGDILVPIAALPGRRVRLVQDNQIRNAGSVISTECPGAPGACMLMSDSYGWAIARYLAESFGRFSYVYSASLDLEYVEREQPDVLLNLVAERFLVSVPSDDAPGIAVQAARKLATGRIRPTIDHWEMPSVPSTGVLEGMRAHLRRERRLRDATMIGVMAYAGLRQAEICRLRWLDVHGGSLVVPTSAHVDGARTIPLPAGVSMDLERWKGSLDQPPTPNMIVFPGRQGAWRAGEWAEWRDSIYAPLATRNGVPDAHEPQLLRHFFAAMLIQRGAGHDELAEQLGITVPEARAWYGPWLSGNTPVPAVMESSTRPGSPPA